MSLDHRRPRRRLGRLERRHRPSAPAPTARRSPRCRSTSRHRRRWTNVGGYVFLDIDQDPSTGLPAEGQFGLPTQDVGMEYFADLFESRTARGSCPSGTSRPSSSSPWSTAIGRRPDARLRHPARGPRRRRRLHQHRHGRRAVRSRSDWAPDEGHGTIEPFVDCPVAQRDARVGHARTRREPGRDDHISGRRPCSRASTTAQVVFSTNAPKQTNLPVDVTLTVTMPDGVRRPHRHRHRRAHRRAAGRRPRHRPRDVAGRPARPHRDDRATTGRTRSSGRKARGPPTTSSTATCPSTRTSRSWRGVTTGPAPTRPSTGSSPTPGST